MKRVATVFACAIAIGAFETHQAEAQTIGFKLGATWSKLDADPEGPEIHDVLPAFGGGGFVRFGFAGLALQAEVLALTKGEKTETANSDYDLKLDYIEVPVTAMFAIGSGPYVFVGPSFAFETGCEVEGTINNIEFDDPCDGEESPGDELPRKTFDIGLTGGLGFQFNVGPGALLIEGRYTHGLTNLSDEETSVVDDFKVRNRSFAAMAGYAIPIGSR